MSTLVAVLDADVLVPILSCDLLLSAFDEDLYRPVVTATILHEIERNLVAGFTHLDQAALRGRVPRSRWFSHITPTTKATPLPQWQA